MDSQDKHKQSDSKLLRVFLCHSSDDKPAVRDLCRRLEASGFHPWLDEKDLIPGQDWHQEIRTAVRKSDAIVVCLSQGSVSKAGFVQKEIKYALDVADEQPPAAIFLIPLRLEKCDVPEQLRKWQWVDYFAEGGYEKLIRALNLRAHRIGKNVSNNADGTDSKRFLRKWKLWVSLLALSLLVAVGSYRFIYLNSLERRIQELAESANLTNVGEFPHDLAGISDLISETNESDSLSIMAGIVAPNDYSSPATYRQYVEALLKSKASQIRLLLYDNKSVTGAFQSQFRQQDYDMLKQQQTFLDYIRYHRLQPSATYEEFVNALISFQNTSCRELASVGKIQLRTIAAFPVHEWFWMIDGTKMIFTSPNTSDWKSGPSFKTTNERLMKTFLSEFDKKWVEGVPIKGNCYADVTVGQQCQEWYAYCPECAKHLGGNGVAGPYPSQLVCEEYVGQMQVENLPFSNCETGPACGGEYRVPLSSTELAGLKAEKREAEAALNRGQPRQAFQHYLSALQHLPKSVYVDIDQDLRQRIIKLALTLNPPPTIPKEALRHSTFGTTALTIADNPAQLDNALKEWQEALRIAPWWAQDYFNSALILEKKHQYTEAIRYLKLYLLAAPRASDANAVEQKIYSLEYLAHNKT